MKIATRMSEGTFQAGVVELGRLLGWRCFYIRDSRGSPPGWPDLVLVKGDRALFRELKAAGGRLSAEQRDWGAALSAAGLDYAVWTPDSWDAITATLKGQLVLGDAA
jgi:hypothetical protein